MMNLLKFFRKKKLFVIIAEQCFVMCLCIVNLFLSQHRSQDNLHREAHITNEQIFINTKI